MDNEFDLIGKGGDGCVYDIGDNKCKKIFDDVETFNLELQIYIKLKGVPNICKYLNSCDSELSITLTKYQYDLDQLRLKLPIETRLQLIDQLVHQLYPTVSLINKEYCHCDLRLCNIFANYDENGTIEVFIGDFGTAEIKLECEDPTTDVVFLSKSLIRFISPSNMIFKASMFKPQLESVDINMETKKIILDGLDGRSFF
jgi:serine/threonine protein kinase